MRLSASPGYWGTYASRAPELEFVVETERLGFHAIWLGEPYGNDVASVLGWYAGATTRLHLGTAVMAIPGRTAAMTAQTAATIDIADRLRAYADAGASTFVGIPCASSAQDRLLQLRRLAQAGERSGVVQDGMQS